MQAAKKEGTWYQGVFVEQKPGVVVLKTGSEEIPVGPGLEIEAAVKESVVYQGVTAHRDDNLYFLGRRPMFALPIALLVGNSGRIQLPR